ncbi:transcription factor activity, sequence-specific DNA binding protein [[Candida] boidinii]|nr:transcription factor activity, sequence-specific DNA binding protein [[Candida] boidinii]
MNSGYNWPESKVSTTDFSSVDDVAAAAISAATGQQLLPTSDLTSTNDPTSNNSSTNTSGGVSGGISTSSTSNVEKSVDGSNDTDNVSSLPISDNRTSNTNNINNNNNTITNTNTNDTDSMDTEDSNKLSINEHGTPVDEKGLPLIHNGKALTNTKRAAQNRAAQRAFRQRRDQYVKDLEVKVTQVKYLEETIEALKTENMQLRDYILGLQSKLLENGDQSIQLPQAPNSSNVFASSDPTLSGTNSGNDK